MIKKVLLIILIIIICVSIGFYIYGIAVKKLPPTDNLLRTVGILCAGISCIIKLCIHPNKKPLKFYELQYKDILQHAFENSRSLHKKLLIAIRHYNSDRYTKAIKRLERLIHKCEKPRDYYAVWLFSALCYTDLKFYDQAESIYRQMIHKNIADSRVYSNLGNVQMRSGKNEDAIRSYEYALSWDRSNSFAYNNLAQAYFKSHDLDSAITYAEKALEYNSKMHQAASLLAIIYALRNDRELYEKYFHIAISAGRNPSELKETVQFYLYAQEQSEIYDEK